MLTSFLFNIPDHRRKQGRRYELGHILLFSILGILSDASSYRKTAAFITANYQTLNKFFELNWKRCPTHTTIRKIIKDTSATELEQAFRDYSKNLIDDGTQKQGISFDGKILRGSFDNFKGQSVQQMLNTFANYNHIILAHEEIDAKTNEIPTAQQLIIELGLSEELLTLDAIHCQEKTLQAAHDTDNYVIVQVKANQKTLFNDCKTIVKTTQPTEIYIEPATKAHNRIESRKVETFVDPTLTHTEKWQLVKVVIKVTRDRQVFDTKKKMWKRTIKVSFYISTIVLSAQEFCQTIRAHWGIENRNHYVRDVTLDEDKSRIRTNPHMFARLRSFALNILRYNKVENISMELFTNCMNIKNIFNYRGVF